VPPATEWPETTAATTPVSIREKIEANPFYWTLGAFGLGFGAALSLLAVVVVVFFAGMEVVPRGSYVPKDEIGSRYVPRSEVDEQFVPRALHSTTLRELQDCQTAAQQAEPDSCGRYLLAVDECGEKLAACEAKSDRPVKSGGLDAERVPQPGQAAPAGPTTMPAAGPPGPPKRAATFEGQWFRLSVESLRVGPKGITAVVAVQATGGEAVEFSFAWGEPYLIDQNGERWNLRGFDTGGLRTGVELIPGTVVRSKLEFAAPRQAQSARSPTPPFAFHATEYHSRQSIIIEGLSPDGPS
jgi:hypothetical protein